MYLILMVYACLISCSLINKSKCHSLAYFNLRWTCVVILHKYRSNSAGFLNSRDMVQTFNIHKVFAQNNCFKKKFAFNK